VRLDELVHISLDLLAQQRVKEFHLTPLKIDKPVLLQENLHFCSIKILEKSSVFSLQRLHRLDVSLTFKRFKESLKLIIRVDKSLKLLG
jgi:hypothetical protein